MRLLSALRSGFSHHLAVLVAAMCLPLAGHTQPSSPSSAKAAAVRPAASADVRSQVMTLAQMGAEGAIALRGVNPTRTLNVGVRLDEVVTAAKLKISYSCSPALIDRLSHLKVTLNEEVVGTLPMDKEHAGQLVTRELDIDPRFFLDFNRLGFQLIAHYVVDQCEDPNHSSLWANISPVTTLTLTKTGVALPDDLALLPAPFFDRRDNRRVTVPFVLPAGADMPTLRVAGVVASWLGALASYREARFPVARTAPADAHAIVFATPAAMPEGLRVAPIDGASVRVMPNPANPNYKLLVVAGRNAKELEVAANALVLGKTAMTGASASIGAVDLGEPRKPYDAPAWAPVDRPVLFRELITDPQQLQISGISPDPIRVNLRLPADLFGWHGRGVPMSVRYRYTAPSTYNDSMLSVDINDQLVRSYRLKPLTSQGEESIVSVPLLTGTYAATTSEILIPAFRVGSNNQMQFRFHLDSQKTNPCASSNTSLARAAVDPDSSIDFSQFSHYTALPNLAYFANSGYPFTRLADLADTAVVIPDTPDARDQEALLTLLGHMGKWTGLPSLRVAVAPAKAIDSVRHRNLLVIGTGTAGQALAGWGKSLPMMIARGKTEIGLRDQRADSWSNAFSGDEEAPLAPAGRAVFTGDGPLAALIGFESPYAQRRSVVAIAATDADRLRDVLDVLEDPGKVSHVRGDLTVIRGEQVEGLRLGERYFVGDLPWYARIWVRVADHPALIAVGGIVAGLVVALAVFWGLGQLAARRRG